MAAPWNSPQVKQPDDGTIVWIRAPYYNAPLLAQWWKATQSFLVISGSLMLLGFADTGVNGPYPPAGTANGKPYWKSSFGTLLFWDDTDGVWALAYSTAATIGSTLYYGTGDTPQDVTWTADQDTPPGGTVAQTATIRVTSPASSISAPLFGFAGLFNGAASWVSNSGVWLYMDSSQIYWALSTTIGDPISVAFFECYNLDPRNGIWVPDTQTTPLPTVSNGDLALPAWTVERWRSQ